MNSWLQDFRRGYLRDLDRHVREGKLEALPEFLKKRFPQDGGTVDGILCWDLIDYMDKASAQYLATELTRLLRPDGALLGFFGTAKVHDSRYTKYVIVDEVNLKHRRTRGARGRQTIMLNRDISAPGCASRIRFSFRTTCARFFRKPA